MCIRIDAYNNFVSKTTGEVWFQFHVKQMRAIMHTRGRAFFRV